VVDVSLLLSAISASSPCGDDLEYDAAFLELERAAQGQPERQMGDAVLAAEPPEWRKVRDLSVDLFGRSKDLRIANYFLHSTIALEGLPGLAQGLSLIRELLSQYWDGLYPRLDADDDNDPTFRLNALSGLVAEPIIRQLWDVPLIRSRTFGTVSLRAALNASGLQRFAGESLNREQLTAAFQDSDASQLADTRNALSQCQTSLAAIESEVSTRVSASQGVDLGPLKQLLRQTTQLLADYAPQAEAPAAESATAAQAGSAANDPSDTSPRASAEIASRDDVLRTLDRILSYYTHHEPSSPVPVLLMRAKTLVTADFAAIVRNLIPDGLSQFEKLRGPGSE